MAPHKTELVLGRGDLYFDRFDPGTNLRRGEFYLGNTLNFTVSTSVERVERFTSYGGQKVPQEGAIIREVHRASFETDNISIENMALWFGKAKQPTTYPPMGLISESFVAWADRYYQLGMSMVPIGARYVENITAHIGPDEIDPGTNFDIDRVSGRIRIRESAPDIVEGETFTVTFEWPQQTVQVLTPTKREQFGALRFIAANPKGGNKNYFYPMVRLSAVGDLNLKGENDWQKIRFEAEARRLDPFTDYVYVDEFVDSSLTADELAIIQHSGVDAEEFPFWENELDDIVNTIIPSHDY